jgi:F-type H+-transporting ATPase subunit b
MEGLLEILGKIGFDWQVALANLVNFLIIFFVLKKFAFKPIGKIIKERQEKIQKGLDDAKQAESALSVANSTKEEIIKEAKDEARKIVTNGEVLGKSIVKDAEAKALLEKENILKQARIDAEKEKQNMEEIFNKESADVIVAGMKSLMEGYVAKGQGEEIIKMMVKR